MRGLTLLPFLSLFALGQGARGLEADLTTLFSSLSAQPVKGVVLVAHPPSAPFWRALVALAGRGATVLAQACPSYETKGLVRKLPGELSGTTGLLWVRGATLLLSASPGSSSGRVAEVQDPRGDTYGLLLRQLGLGPLLEEAGRLEECP